MKGEYIVMKCQLELKPISRISKTGIRSIIGKMLDYTVKYEYHYTLNEDTCQNMCCPVFARYNELKTAIDTEQSKPEPDILRIKELTEKLTETAKSCASSGCHGANVKRVYLNDKKRYNLYQYAYANKRFPKSALKMYLLLYSIPQEILGTTHFIKDISADILASTLNIHKVTVKRTLEMLTAFNYITCSHASSSDSYNIIINDYDSMHLKASEGGAGYFTLTAEMVSSMLSISNVNAFRLEVLKLLKSDELSSSIIGSHTYSIHDLKNILPQHMNYEKAYVKINKEPSLFSNGIANGKIHFMLKHGIELHTNIQQYTSAFYTYFKSFTESISLQLSDSVLNNICDLTTEYTKENISKSLQSILFDYKDRFNTIGSLGALLRAYCRRNICKPIYE